jgi:hypothetical protein
MRRAQSTTEYMMTISVIVIAIIVVLRLMLGTIYDGTGRVAGGLQTSLTTSGVQ